MTGGEEITTEVLVVGAGPTGLMLAVTLARLGVDAVVIDGKPGPTRESRALVVQARSLEVYDQLGLIEPVLAEGASAIALVPGAGARPFGRFDLRLAGRDVSEFNDVFVLEQSKNERILADALDVDGRPPLWQHRLVDLRPAAGTSMDAATGVVATLDGPDGEVRVRARYCVGADGAHSAVRKAMGVAFSGVTNEHTFFVADATGTTGLVPESINVRVAEDDILLGFTMGGPGRDRLLGVVRDRDLEPDGTLPEQLVRDRMRDHFGVEYRERTWFATYRLHHRVADRFRVGPCFVAGDAAHIHSPVGGQGMNTGLQDAHNLACAIADVVLGGMPDSRLDRYEAERRPVARTLVETTDRLFAAVTSESRTARLVRGRLAPIVGPVAIRLLPLLIGRRRLFGYVSQTRIRYRMSPPDARVAPADPAVGLRLPWVGDNHVALRAFSWQVHGYGASAALVERIARDLGVEHHVFAPDPHGRLRADRVYIVRRDGFVAAAASADPDRRGVPLAFVEQLAG
ncbi:FAD-dependent monooxygenase [Agromyces sp. LHK192]|uniref:FAD-dependent monooxygenase n=1 Tax=Agromyces sp. LHK192 TaxID=2498704 RepID=UPI00196B0FFF|nr:FAD-dependent monooxygenase [Agromyces sp. LHK192]